MRNRGTVIGDLVAVRDTEVEPSIDSMDWTFALITDSSLLPPPGDDGKDGRDGVDGKDGRDGFNGRDGKDGADGKNGEPGMQWAGMYSRRVAYRPGQCVGFAGSSYVCIRESVGHEPTSTRYFQPVALQGEQGRQGEQGGAGQRGRSSIALQNEMRQQIDEISERIDELEIDGVTTALAVFTDAASTGMPVRIEDDGTAYLAVAQLEDDYTRINWQGACNGLALEDVEASESGRYATDGILELEDWSSVTGTVHLDPGSTYILSETEPGKLIKWDADASYLMKQIIGTALSETQLDIEIETAVYSNKRQAEFDSESLSGMLVYESGDDHVDNAIADDLATAAAVGLTFGNNPAGHIGNYYIHGPIIAPDKDWTDSTGSPELVPGPYYLSDTDAGMMVSDPPTTPGHYLVKLGEATDANTFFIKIEPPELIT